MKSRKSFYEQSGGTYTQVGDVLLPDLSIGDSEQIPIGKYGRIQKRHLKELHPILYSDLSLSGKLYPHLLKTNEACEERMELLMQQMAKQKGVTEALKAADQMEWVRHMKSIQNRAEEIVLHELVYAEEGEDANT